MARHKLRRTRKSLGCLVPFLHYHTPFDVKRSLNGQRRIGDVDERKHDVADSQHGLRSLATQDLACSGQPPGAGHVAKSQHSSRLCQNDRPLGGCRLTP